MDRFYTELIKHFNNQKTKDFFRTEGLEPPRTIDLNAGQINNPENFEVLYPAIFIDWSEKQDGITEPLVLDLEFHVVQLPSFGTENFANTVKQGTDYLKYLKVIKKVLHLFRTDFTSRMQFIGLNPNITPYYKLIVRYFLL